MSTVDETDSGQELQDEALGAHAAMVEAESDAVDGLLVGYDHVKTSLKEKTTQDQQKCNHFLIFKKVFHFFIFFFQRIFGLFSTYQLWPSCKHTTCVDFSQMRNLHHNCIG